MPMREKREKDVKIEDIPVGVCMQIVKRKLPLNTGIVYIVCRYHQYSSMVFISFLLCL